ncbi:hypothetical protein [Ensifer canadensis]
MLFNIEYDIGGILEGYLVPDGFSEQPSIVVSDETGDILVLPCDQLRQGVVDAGRHFSGYVGFRVDTSHIPDLDRRLHLTIRDQKTKTLIYRRPPIKNTVGKKVFRIETQMIPLTKFDQYFGNHFQYILFGLDRFGHETISQAFHMHAISSVYLSGRISFRTYEDALDRGYEIITLLEDPYYEMAGRLFLLSRMGQMTPAFIGDRDRLALSSAVEYFSSINLNDRKSLTQALKRAPQKVTAAVASPLTTQLAASSADQPPRTADIAAAVDVLSRFTIVGHTSDIIGFQQSVSDLVGLPLGECPFPQHHSVIEQLAQMLREMPIAELLLENDLILHHYVGRAIDELKD